jgi:cytochrome c oxidase subunit 3
VSDPIVEPGVVRHEVAHHFATAEQEFSSAKFGLWVFLATEILMFGGLFVAYTVFRGMLPETFSAAHRELSVPLGTVNTLVLISSSLTMALSIRAAMVNARRQMMAFLWATLLLATTFLVVKLAFEWPHKFHEGMLPGRYYTFEGLAHVASPHIFFSLYFMMTGLHGIHVLIGMGLIGFLLWKGGKGHFYAGYYTPVEMVGLYWHLVDLIWIFLFPLFYLIG